jgi:GNAT superfamily N-acetyltransferase
MYRLLKAGTAGKISDMLTIRKGCEADRPIVWRIIREVIACGDTYVFLTDTPEDEMLDYWFAADKHTYVAEQDDDVVATFWIKANQPGFGSHVANAAYMVSSDARGQGVGKQIALWSLEEARRLGFTAMQFNFVVKTNPAVRLWQAIGFEIIGEIPDAFNSPSTGLVNAYIMYRKL